MKAALVTDELAIEKGTGIARYSSELLKGLEKIGIDVEVISTNPPRLPYGMAINHSLLLPHIVLKKAGDFDLIHATAPITAISFPFIKTPKIVTFHDLVSILCESSGVRAHAKFSIPFLFRIAAKYSDKIIAVSSQTKEELVRYLKVPEEKIIVINSGIGEEFVPNEKKECDCYVIGYIGALAPRKRIDYAIRAFQYLRKKHPALKVKFHIYGKTGQEYSKLVELVKRLDLTEDVEFKSFVPDEKLVETYNSFDVLVMPSEWEGFCIPILEAQRCGVPVVIRGDAHIPPEVTKYCIKAKSEEEIADKMYELLIDEDLRNKVINEGLNYSKRFTWEKTVDETTKVYEEIL